MPNPDIHKRITVKGLVVDQNKEPVPGVAVIIKHRPDLGGSVTNGNGEFRLEVPDSDRLTVQFSCIGYQIVEKTLSDTADWLIVMKEDTEELEATVVVGYGVQRKESVVGAISQVKAEDLKGTGTTSLTNSLAGKVAGMTVYSTSGLQSEGEASFLIRGMSSWNGNAPLVMVDGIERDMKSLSPSDIASISVLKDASATAVYGAKGANGVILVTTKTGAKGKPKFQVNVEQGMNFPLFIPEHIDAATIADMANIAYRNIQSFGSQFSNEIIQKYADQTEPLRYPDVDWYDLILKDFSLSTNADISMTGGTDKVRYYLGVGYVHDGSIIREVQDGTNFSYDKFTYRLNLDWDITRSTILEFKVGGVTTIAKDFASSSTSSTFFSTMYQAPTVSYPAFYPDWALSKYPDPNYPDADEVRISGNQGATYSNPYAMLMDPDYAQTMQNRLMTDVILTQKLDFITEGLAIKGKFGLTSTYSRIGKQVNVSYPSWDINWDMMDNGGSDVWNMTPASSNYVWNNKPYAVTQNNSASGTSFITYVEASLSYNRKFSRKHNVSALALYNQRQYNSGASFPRRTQSYVGRITYDYMSKYLFEANLGVTGSEQFSPAYRYGVFPSAAIGYYISKEKFWKQAMPWWSTFKVRYSNGYVGSDSSDYRWLYYSSWSKTGNYIFEDASANKTARWETAHKQDLGIELGWMNDALTLNIDLFNERRYNMLMSPIVTPFVGVAYKDINAGGLKKHGVDIELNWAKKTKRGFAYNIGGMIGLNENRITKYGDMPYAPEYQKYANTLYGSSRTGDIAIDDKFFNSIDEIHGYPLYTAEWSKVVPGVYKFLDYYPDGKITQNDLHVVKGTVYPPAVYSINFGCQWKGLSFKVLCTGTIGKYINYRRASIIPFYAGDLVIHKSHTDYWSPDNHDAEIPALSFSDLMYSWAGGTSSYPGYNLTLPGFTWKKSDYFSIKEVMLAYTFSGDKIRKRTGADYIKLGLTCNNLLIFKDKTLYDVDPQRLTTATIYYPTLRALKFSLNIGF